MAKHEVKFSVPSRPLAYKDIEFSVKSNGAKFGELKISQGGAFWVPRDHSQGFHLNWKRLASLLEEHGTKRKMN
ncbi:MAG: hypothetical protein HEQ23_09050 [Tepidisphaera sp.]